MKLGYRYAEWNNKAPCLKENCLESHWPIDALYTTRELSYRVHILQENGLEILASNKRTR